MPTTEQAIAEINRVYRDHRRFTGDGLPGAPTNAPLPVGDSSTGAHSPKKSEIRTAHIAALAAAGESAEEAAGFAEQAAAYADFARNNWAVAAYGTGIGAQADIPLLIDPGSINNMFVVVGGLFQPVSFGAFQLVYTGGDPFIRISVPAGEAYEVRVSNGIDVGEPSDGSVSTAKLAPGAVETDKVADRAVSFGKIQEVAGPGLVGRDDAGPGPVRLLTQAEASELIPATVPAGTLIASYKDANVDLDPIPSTGSTRIPLDGTVPQRTEGKEICSITLTPKSATSEFRIMFSVQGALAGVENWVAAIFSSLGLNALAYRYTITPTANYTGSMLVMAWLTPGVTTPITFSGRVGPNGSTLNIGGWEIQTVLTVDEFKGA